MQKLKNGHVHYMRQHECGKSGTNGYRTLYIGISGGHSARSALTRNGSRHRGSQSRQILEGLWHGTARSQARKIPRHAHREQLPEAQHPTLLPTVLTPLPAAAQPTPTRSTPTQPEHAQSSVATRPRPAISNRSKQTEPLNPPNPVNRKTRSTRS